MTDEKILEELALIEKKHGVLKPEDVVAFAENPKTALHKKFTWDNTEAARLYRIYEARQIIRVTVNISEYSGDSQRVYVSLYSDRDEGGYRSLVTVLSDESMRKQLLADAIKDMEIFKAKYYGLKELSRVFMEMEKIPAKKPKKSINRGGISANA